MTTLEQRLAGAWTPSLKDETGTVSLNPIKKQFELMGTNIGIAIDADSFDPSVEFKFKHEGNTGSSPVMMEEFLNPQGNKPVMSVGQQALEQHLNEYRSKNPDWYRYIN